MCVFICVDVWYHIAVSYDYAVGNFSLYIDGVQHYSQNVGRVSCLALLDTSLREK